MPHAAPIPALSTLDQQPSWHNRAGRADRSCCFVLTAASLWRHLTDDAWHDRPWIKPRAGAAGDNFRGRPDRVGSITLTAEDLWHLHRFERPSPLRGDFRTPKANAFRPAADATRWWNEVGAPGRSTAPGSATAAGPHPGAAAETDAQGTGRTAAGSLGGKPTAPSRLTTPSPLDPPAVNPNRGAGFSMGLKMLGLPADWSTTLTIERYVQHARLKQHFLVCPVCGPPDTDPRPASGSAAGSQPADAPPSTRPSDHRPTPHASTGRGPAAKGGGQDTSTARKKKLPRGRVTKLFLPLCTPREWHDAQLAHLWLQTHTNLNRPYTPAAQQLLTRYAELFPGRNLRCRQCLRLRYGEVKGMG